MEEDNMIPLSYVSQYNYCKRRAGLLLLEQQWNESTDTAKGRVEHKNVHSASIEQRGSITVISDLCITSKKLNLSGKCDAIEAVKNNSGSNFPFLNNDKYLLYPIEYKHGKLRNELEYELQLCAQAICLEETYNCQIDKGAIFYISSHRRCEVIFTEALRTSVIETAKSLSEMLVLCKMPQAESSSKCLKCSLKDICIPDVPCSAKKYIKSIYSDFSRKESIG